MLSSRMKGHAVKAIFLTALAVALGAAAGQAADEGLEPEVSRVGAPDLVAVTAIVPGASIQDVFRHPSGLFVDAGRGMFLVADRGNNRIVLFDDSGRCRGSISFPAPSPREDPNEPLTMATDSTGRLFVVAGGENRVQVMNSRGSRLGYVDAAIPANSGSRPRAVDVGASGSVYVLYGGPLAGVVVTDRTGKVQAGQGLTLGAEPVGSAVSLAVNETAGLMAIVSAKADKQVRLYGLDGRPVAEFGGHGEGDGTFSLAAHAAWGPESTVWITDTLRHSISVFDARGNFLGRIGGFGRNPGQFNFPVACGFLADGRLIVLERGTARCQILEVVLIPPDPLTFVPGVSVPATTNGTSNLTGGDSQ